MVASGQADRLYDPAAQEQAYRDADPKGEAPAIWIERHRLLGGFFYPPPAALAYSALAWLPMRQAAILLAYLNIAVGAGLAWYFARRIHGSMSVATAGLAFFLYPAYFVTVSLGQNAVFTLGVILFAWDFCNRRREFCAGLLLGLLVCKPNWLIAIGWIPLIHGRWRVLAGMVCGSAAVLGVSACVIGIDPFWNYIGLMRSLAGLHDIPGYNLDLTYNGLSLFRRWLSPGPSVELLGWGAGAAVIAATWRVTRGCWKPGTPDFKLLMGCSLTASLWINPHLFYYDLLLTVVCILTMLSAWPELGLRERVTVVVLISASYLAIPWDDQWPWGHLLPIPTLTTLALWGWFCWRLESLRRKVPQLAAGLALA